MAVMRASDVTDARPWGRHAEHWPETLRARRDTLRRSRDPCEQIGSPRWSPFAARTTSTLRANRYVFEYLYVCKNLIHVVFVPFSV